MACRALALVMDPPDPDVLRRQPRAPSEPILGRREWGDVIYTGVLQAAVTLGVFGRPFALLQAIEGRREDTLVLPRSGGGEAVIHPNVFHGVLERLPLKQWQVAETDSGVLLRLVPGEPPVDPEAVAAEVRGQLAAADAQDLRVVAELTDRVERTKLGKAPLVQARPKERRAD